MQSIVDCTDAPTVSFEDGGDNLFVTTGTTGELTISGDCQQGTALHIDVDKEGVVPMVVREQGYEWVPVYTRKLT